MPWRRFRLGGFVDIDWSKAEAVCPTAKKPLSIWLDQEVVDFFQASGKGYQTRINAVLRHDVQPQKACERSTPKITKKTIKKA
ncbi:BrnA antitoxin family protein [Rhizobium gallicum]|uniref:BrnA antitoxin family protein n=1 Tax=Rhizobium gallicum TaxID=56730 RepID=UPI001EF91F3B|nr:BrnA antitoxin family protein [Rhizobium gallicum]ULJ72771.1 BrnA antitoxin family protein [Rhizobium gallicum]